MSVLILDGHLKSSLASVRELGTAGIKMTVGAEQNSAMALHSKYTKSAFVYTSPKVDQEKFVEEVRAQAESIFTASGEKPVVYCFSDATHLSLARAYDHLREMLRLPLPKREHMEVAFDKKNTYQLAYENNVPTIQTYNKEQYDDVAYPAVVKTRHSVAWKDGKGISGTAEFVFSRDELEKKVDEITEKTGEFPLVQKFIQGDEYGVELLCKDGKSLQEFSHKRIRSLSPRGGAAVVKETAMGTPEVHLMYGYAKILMQKLKWTGPAMIEFKIDDKDNSVKLMEINGRFWGSLPLAQRAGVHFSYGYYQLAKNEVVKNPPDFSPKLVRTYHFLGDVKWLLSVLFKKDSLRKTVYPSRIKALWDFGTEIFRGTSDVYSFKDPLPSIYEIIDVLNKKTK